MEVTTRERYRVLGCPRRPEERLLVETETFDPVYVPAADLPDVESGYVVDATLRWRDGTPRVTDVDVVRRTRLEFLDEVTGLFEAARETWQAAERAGEAMNSRVTYGTDGDPNGICYVFGEQPGAPDLFSEFESGHRPLEPLLQRANDHLGPAARSVFVMRPVDDPFVLVYIVLEAGGLLDRTVRETYDGLPEE